MCKYSYIHYVTKNSGHMKIVYDLQQAAYQVEAKIIDYPKLPPLTNTISDIMLSGCEYRACRMDVKAAGGKDVGVIGFEEKEDAILIHTLVVHPDFFHKGIASFLIEQLVNEKTLCKTFYVATAKKNVPACNLYETCGFILMNEMEKPDITLVEYVKKVD